MENKHVLMGAVPGVALAIFVVLAVPGSALVGSQTVDGFPVHGYVTVSVMRDGQEIYHHEDHNEITNAGKDFISAQLGSTSAAANGANYIALSNTAFSSSPTATTLAGELDNTNGLGRSQGTYAHTNGQSTYTISKTFTATGSQSAQSAGLFTASTGGTMMARNGFTSVSLASGDQLTITWTITLS